MTKIFMVITNTGDGANGTLWVKDPAVIDRMQALADQGDDYYASGDGLQVNEFKFPDGFDIEAWAGVNSIGWMDLEEVG